MIPAKRWTPPLSGHSARLFPSQPSVVSTPRPRQSSLRPPPAPPLRPRPAELTGRGWPTQAPSRQVPAGPRHRPPGRHTGQRQGLTGPVIYAWLDEILLLHLRDLQASCPLTDYNRPVATHVVLYVRYTVGPSRKTWCDLLKKASAARIADAISPCRRQYVEHWLIGPALANHFNMYFIVNCDAFCHHYLRQWRR